jgi:MFS family permease
MYLPSIVIVNIYFEKKRGVAQSIMSAGSGIGMIVMSPVVEKILTVYDWRGALKKSGGAKLVLWAQPSLSEHV